MAPFASAGFGIPNSVDTIPTIPSDRSGYPTRLQHPARLTLMAGVTIRVRGAVARTVCLCLQDYNLHIANRLRLYLRWSQLS